MLIAFLQVPTPRRKGFFLIDSQPPQRTAEYGRETQTDKSSSDAKELAKRAKFEKEKPPDS
jgi:hypothetical protein